MKQHIIGWVSLIIGIFVLAACTQNEEENNLIYTYNFSETGQKINIVHAHTLYEQYIEKAKDDESGRLALYKETVIEPVYEACFEDAEFIHMAKPILNTAPKHFMELEKMTSEMAERQDELNAFIQEALKKSMALLPSESDISVCLFPSSDMSLSMFAAGAGKIIIPYNRHYTDEYIKVGVAHEYHHSTWAEQHLSDWMTVLDNLIFEGKAVMFEKLVYPAHEIREIYEDYNQELWEQIEPDLNKVSLERSMEILYGGGEFPYLYGYSEGYKMIRAFLEANPSLTPAEWTAVSSEEVIEKGKYFEYYK